MNELLQYILRLFAFDSNNPLLFTQFNFWAFFLFVFAGFCLMVGHGKQRHSHTRTTLRNTYLFLISLLFYYKTSGLFVLLLIFSTCVGYLLGIWLDRTQRPSVRKALAATGVVVNLAVLCYFKYAYFFTDIYNTVTLSQHEVVNLLAQWSNHFTTTHHFDASTIVLPVGISFFTFQNISYIVDVYKRKIAHVGNILDFGFYTTFFPQLVAGPIIRADQFVPQLYKPYHLARRQFGIAVFWILNGLVKKIILSDYLAVSFVDRIFDNPLLYTPFENFSALMLYSLQVYADFSGYTDIAIGVAMLMGFYLPVNFNSPYKATNPAGFWHRWHISLSNWLKDYLYIPLGGNRSASWVSYLILGGTLAIVGLMANTAWVWLAVSSVAGILVAVYLLFPNHRKEFNTNVNNMDTMLLGGLWHGASFNFITWGGLNGMGILVYKWWKKVAAWPRIVIIIALFAIASLVRQLVPCPLTHMLAFAMLIIGIAITLTETAKLLTAKKHTHRPTPWITALCTVWNTLLTFVFISFTRLFFRSGSNLNPTEANEVAWNTAKNMVHQIGSPWNLQQIPDIVANYRGAFIMFAIGMAVHWLPTRFKRRYRLWFAATPLWLMALATATAVFVVYQFITADLQPFIYFQF